MTTTDHLSRELFDYKVEFKSGGSCIIKATTSTQARQKGNCITKTKSAKRV